MTKPEEPSSEKQVAGSGSFTVDIQSPYYMHASDHPGQIFVPDLPNDTNYGEWSGDMAEVLFAKNKFGFVDKTLTVPDETAKEYNYWVRCDVLVRGWLKASMNLDLRRSVRYATTACQIWDDLKDRFGRGSASRAYELRHNICLLRQEDLGVSAYYTRQRALWDELCAITPRPQCTCSGCNCDIQKKMREAADKEHLFAFLMGLDENYAAIRSHILSLQTTPLLAQAYNMVAEDEQQREISTYSRLPSEAAALQKATTPARSDASAFQVRSHGSDSKPDKSMIRCPVCRCTGHVRDECFKVIGYPDWWKGRTGITTATNDSTRKPIPRAAQVVVSDASSQLAGITSDQLAKLLALIGHAPSSNMTNANMSVHS
ncbi:hypothetical protein LINGRAHAP2_LOCUS17851 [Linum grandiflorum]